MNYKVLAVTVGTAFIMTACIPVVVGGGAATSGVVVAQDRSTGNAVDDAGIRLKINDLFIKQNVDDLFRNVNIDVVEGRVMLTGSVDKSDTVPTAEKLAWQVHGVKEVINEIQVDDNTGVLDYTKDSWIDAQIRSKLLFEKNLRSVNYTVQTVNHVVYLLGIAQDQAELDKATYLASTTAYVTRVVSHVIMKDDPRRNK